MAHMQTRTAASRAGKQVRSVPSSSDWVKRQAASKTNTADFLRLLAAAPIDRLKGMARRPDQIPSIVMRDFGKRATKNVFGGAIVDSDTAEYLHVVYPVQLTLPEMIHYFTHHPEDLKEVVWVVFWLDEVHGKWLMATLERLPNGQVELFVAYETSEAWPHPQHFRVLYRSPGTD